MDAVRPGLEGTDFTLQIVLTHLSSLIIAIASGKLADTFGYQGLFVTELVLALVVFLSISFLFQKQKKESVCNYLMIYYKNINQALPRYTSYPPAKFF